MIIYSNHAAISAQAGSYECVPGEWQDSVRASGSVSS